MRDDYTYSWDHAKDSGMTLEATLTTGHPVTFDNVAIDSARVEKGVLVFENDDTSTKVKVYYVPNVLWWTTYYR